jgi:hypothetical protein
MRTRTLVRTQRRNPSRRVPAIVAGCVLAVALVGAGTASALSKRWTLRHIDTNHVNFERYDLRPIEVAPVTSWKFGLERLPDGCSQGVGTKIDCNLLPPNSHQSWELERPYYAMDVTYRVTGPRIGSGEDVRVEYRVKNWLVLQDVECRFRTPGHHWTHWAEKQDVMFGPNWLVCEDNNNSRRRFADDSIFTSL